MIVGIVGDAERAVMGIIYVRNIVRQVVLAPHVHDLNRVDACLSWTLPPIVQSIYLTPLRGIPCFLSAISLFHQKN